MQTQLVMGGGRTLWLGKLGALPRHRFAANAILVGLDDSFEVHVDGRVEHHHAAFVRGWQWHGLDFHGGRTAVLFLEPGVRPSRRVDPRELKRNVEEALRVKDPGLWTELFQSALHLDVRAGELDPRVARAAKFLSTPEDSPLSAPQLAQRLGLSTSHIEHRFRAQVGVPMGAYRAWFRMQAATAMAILGQNLTDLAHATGFCDSAHFSKLFHQMFGLPPSKVFTPELSGSIVEAPWSR